jgi:oxygen-independent coproporphyrinogen-3 oxidase
MREGPPAEAEDVSLGVYLHVPFCERICPYCDFAVVAARPLRPPDEERYVAALLAELALRAPAWEGHRLATVYLGGGTPSLLQPESVARLVEGVRSRFEATGPIEVTLETNPSTTPSERLAGFRDCGVNRLSIGVQSFDDAKLKALGRAHRAEECRSTLAAARQAGFENLSIDLMFRAPNESVEQLERDLEAFATAGSQHVSTYELTIEANTPFGDATDAGRMHPRLGEDETAQLMQRIDQRLLAAGFGRYELASYARPGFESVHNRRYWERLPVLGLGMGAWSSTPCSADAPHGGRRSNVRELAPYLERTLHGEAPDDSVELLSPSVARGEAVLLGLRRSEGVDGARFEREFGGPPRHFYAAQIDELLGLALIFETPFQGFALTDEGRLLADSVAERFV